jgi:hypothetical protein
MKITTALLAGVAMLASSFAGAQFYSQASVSGLVLSEGPQGFMLEGPDGNYGIIVTPSTVVTDPWSSLIVTGPGNVVPGDFVTATGYPTSQWIMRSTQVVVRNATPPTVFRSFVPTAITGPGILPNANTFAPIQQGVTNFNTLPNALNNRFNPLPTPLTSAFNPFAVRSFRR